MKDSSEHFRRVASPEKFQRFMGGTMKFKKTLAISDLSFLANSNPTRDLFDTPVRFTFQDFDGSQDFNPSLMVEASAKKMLTLPVILNSDCFDMFIGQQPWDIGKFSISSFVSADIQWGTAEALQRAVDNFITLSEHIFGSPARYLTPLLKGIVDNKSLTALCVHTPLFPAALIQSKLVKLYNQWRAVCHEEFGMGTNMA